MPYNLSEFIHRKHAEARKKFGIPSKGSYQPSTPIPNPTHKELTMPKTGDMYPSRYLKASDCEDGDITLTIKEIRQERIGQGRDADDKWILFFEEEEKGLVLNKTNTNTIAKLYGDDTDDWDGKQVTLFSTEVSFQGDMVEAIRVRSKPPKARGKVAKTAPAEDDDGEEFDETSAPSTATPTTHKSKPPF